MTPRGPTVAEIRAKLEERALAVAQDYARPAPGSYLDRGDWWALNPGRADSRVGSFVVHTQGARKGQWHDFAANLHGDLIDLIALSLGCDTRAAIAEARRYLGLGTLSPEASADLQRAADERDRRIAAEAAKAEDARQRRAAAAHAIWLNADPRLRGTPVEAYLRDRRGIDLAQLGHQPGCLRYAARHRYVHTDLTTGEVTEAEYPAMLALIHGPDGGVAALHRTWLAEGPGGWDKAPVPAPKKVLGSFAGGSIHLWRGAGTGPRGGRGAPLAQAPQGSRVYITEGIEDGLSVVMANPRLRVLCAVSLGNMGAVALPPAIAEIVLVADRDENPAAQAALQRAIRQHREAGRRVRLWQNRHGGKDFNDAWRAHQARAVAGGA